MGEHQDLKPDREPARRPGFLSTLQSVLAAAFGVQSQKKREQDFSSGSPVAYIVAGILFTVVFVLGLLAVVRAVLPG